MPDFDYFDNLDMGSGLFMPFYFSYPYRFNYGFLKNFFYPFGFSRGYKTIAERSGKQFLQSTEGFNSTAFSEQAQPEFFTTDFEKAFYNENSKAYKSAYERHFTDISKIFFLINKTSDILKTTDYQKSYLYSNMEAFEKNFAGNLAKDLYKSDFTSLIEPKNTSFSNLTTKITEFTNPLTQTMGFTNPLTQITEFTNGLTKITGFSNPLKAANSGFLQQHEIINSVLQSQSENPVFLKSYEGALNTASALEKTPNFGITSGFLKSNHASIFPNFKTESTPYKSTENFTLKAVKNQSAILQNLSKQEQNFYLYGKSGNTVFQSLENQAEKNMELVPLKFSPKSSEKSLVIGEQTPLQKPYQATPEKSLTTAGIDLDSLLEMICSALEEELNTCAEGVHL